MIGIIGGMGPAAGVELSRLLVTQSPAATDQAHVPFMLLNSPGSIASRPAFLSGDSSVNPGDEIARLAGTLIDAGATTLVIPCITAHAPAILAPVLESIDGRARFVHLIDQTAAAVAASTTGAVGVLSTVATKHAGLFTQALQAHDLATIEADAEEQLRVNALIASVKAGQHACPSELRSVAHALHRRGANSIILGCTELPLIGRQLTTCTECSNVDASAASTFIDPLAVLARALVESAKQD